MSDQTSRRARFIGLSDTEIQAANDQRKPVGAVGQVKACGARKRDPDKTLTGKLCSQPAGWKTDHYGFGYCKWHGGNTPGGKAYGARLAAEAVVEETRNAMRFYGRRIVIDATDALQDELSRSAGIVAWLDDMIGRWSMDDLDEIRSARLEDALNPDRDDERDQVALDRDTGLPQLVAVHSTEKALGFTDTEQAAWLKVYQQERAHYAKIAKLCIDANIQERQQRVLESRSVAMGMVVRAVLVKAGLDVSEDRLVQLVQESIDEVSASDVRALTA